MPRATVFLGAGASRVFDYPTTEEFVRNLSLSQNGKRILNSITRAPEIKDSEHILQTIDAIITFNSNTYVQAMFKQSQPSIPLVDGSVVRWNEFVDLCSSLKETMIIELHRQYQFDQRKLQKVIDTYHPLIEQLSKVNESQLLDLFTTNYDSVIENYCEESDKEVQFTCGFSIGTRGRREFWNPEQLGRWKGEFGKGLGIKLYKLHGSLDWRETDDGRIERIRTEEKVSPEIRRYKRNILIYPAQKDYLTEEPFGRLMKYFEEVLNQHNSCLVIGFSFRDPFINRTFLDFLRAERKRGLIVVSLNASADVKNNLLKNEKKLEKQVTCFDKPFGEPETFNLIVQALEGKPISPEWVGGVREEVTIERRSE